MRTSDERREVAQRLRESREFISGLPKMPLEQNVFDVFERILACVGYERGNIFDRLADLIEPQERTCRISDTDHEYEDSVRCDACQSTFRRPWEPFKYCPECGARVVRDDDAGGD